MPVEITMPQLSDTMTEGTLVKWLAAEGDAIKAGQPIAEIETDKATMEAEAYDGGTLAALLVQPGEKVPVGAAIAVLIGSGEKAADVKKQYSAKRGEGRKATQAAAKPAQASAAKPVQAAADTRGHTGSAASTATLEQASHGEVHESGDVGHAATRSNKSAAPAAGTPAPAGNGHRIHASPLARRTAADKSVALESLRGSGPNGRIVQRDVLDFVARAETPANSSAATAPQRPGAGQKQVIPFTKMRQAIADALQQSKQRIPHFYEIVDIDVEAVADLRQKLNEQLKPQNIKLSLADFVVKAAAAALQLHPAVNATLSGSEITRWGDVHIGIAVAIPDGLIVPVLKNVQGMGLREIRQQSADLIERARAQKLRQGEGGGGTFTISNLGSFGIREFSAIINPPQVAILAVGAAEKRAVVRDDQIVRRTIMTVTLSADHRAVDGAVAADFLHTLKGLLEDPGMMLA